MNRCDGLLHEAASSRLTLSRATSARKPARAVLNFGHTVGHAIEAVAGYDGPYQHGEAVAIGMVAESQLAYRLGWIGVEIPDRLKARPNRFGLPTGFRAGSGSTDRRDESRQEKPGRASPIRFAAGSERLS